MFYCLVRLNKEDSFGMCDTDKLLANCEIILMTVCGLGTGHKVPARGGGGRNFLNWGIG